MPKQSKRRTRFVIVSLVIVTLLGVGGTVLFTSLKNNSSIQTGSTPNFKALLPSNTSIEDLGGWQKLTPPNSDPFYVYVDEIDSTLIKVSQQASPPNTNVSEIAKAYNATGTLDADGTKVYIGSSAKGPQSLLFSKNNLLVLIVSQQKIQDTAWISYINKLR